MVARQEDGVLVKTPYKKQEFTEQQLEHGEPPVKIRWYLVLDRLSSKNTPAEILTGDGRR